MKFITKKKKQSRGDEWIAYEYELEDFMTEEDCLQMFILAATTIDGLQLVTKYIANNCLGIYTKADGDISLNYYDMEGTGVIEKYEQFKANDANELLGFFSEGSYHKKLVWIDIMPEEQKVILTTYAMDQADRTTLEKELERIEGWILEMGE